MTADLSSEPAVHPAAQDWLRGALQRQRSELAREVHDVVGHAMTVIHVQAAAALQLIGEQAPEAAPVLASIKAVSRQALDEMRGVLALAERRTGVGTDRLAALAALAADMRRCGLAVELRICGERPLPPAVDLAAYRIVQESLTNVLRHAGPATAAVTVYYEPDALVLEITDDGHGTGTGLGNGGRGIGGMRERARALGGFLEASPREAGGFRVLARLPLETLSA